MQAACRVGGRAVVTTLRGTTTRAQAHDYLAGASGDPRLDRSPHAQAMRALEKCSATVKLSEKNDHQGWAGQLPRQRGEKDLWRGLLLRPSGQWDGLDPRHPEIPIVGRAAEIDDGKDAPPAAGGRPAFLGLGGWGGVVRAGG